MTDAVLPLALFVMGLASGAHCLGMCGGIVGAFASPRPLLSKEALWKRQLAFNGGRIATYGLAGLVAGAIGGAGAYLTGALPLQTALYVVANVLLVCVGLQLAGLWTPLRWMEYAGTPLWRLAQPFAARFAAGGNAWLAGMAWGWLPCGLVYGALAASVFAGSPLRGALAMLAFGLGTLPWLLAAGMLAQRLRLWTARPALRRAAGAFLLGFGAWGLSHASGLPESVRQAWLCF